MSGTAPKSGKYEGGKLWFERKGSRLSLGVTDEAIDEIGELTGADVPSEGDDFEKGEVLLTLRGTDSEINVIAPATGIVESVNPLVEEELERIARDPQEEGWLVHFEIEDLTELQELGEE